MCAHLMHPDGYVFQMHAGQTLAGASPKGRRASVMATTDGSTTVAGSSKSYTSQQAAHKLAATIPGEADAKAGGLPPVPTAIKAHRRSVN